MRQRHSTTSAFTLIELLVVIVILGILMAVAVPTFLRQQQKAQDSKTQQQLTTAYKAIRSGLSEFNNQYPAVASVVSAIAQSEPELTVSSGSCNASTSDKQVVVDNVTSSANRLSLYAKSSSGSWWRLTAPASGMQALTKLGSCQGVLSTAALTAAGNEITDSTRASANQGDGRAAPDSSYGLWEATTNLFPNGGFESNTSGWSPSSGSSAISQDTSLAKFGSSSLKVVSTAPSGARTTGYATTSGTVYTASVWVDAPAGMGMQMQWVRSDFATVVGANNFTAAGGWQRVTVTVTAPASETEYLFVKSTAATSTFWIDGAQLEQLGYATPYVETNGATATRNAARLQAPSALTSASQGWVAARVRYGVVGSAVNGGLYQYGDSTNGMTVYWSGTNWAFEEAKAGTLFLDNASQADPSATVGGMATVVAAWDANFAYVSVNGSAFTKVARTHIPTVAAATFDIGDLRPWFAGSNLDGDLLWFATGTGTLTSSDAATINNWGNTDPTTQAFPAAAQATLAWSADNGNYVSGN